MSLSQDKDGEGAKELEELHSDRMKVLQLDVCSDEQVKKAVEFIRDNLQDSQRGKSPFLMHQNPNFKKTDITDGSL